VVQTDQYKSTDISVQKIEGRISWKFSQMTGNNPNGLRGGKYHQSRKGKKKFAGTR